MKTKLARVIERIVEMRDQANDDDFVEDLDNALIHLDEASDRLIAMDEDEGEDD
jgi:hypothetical protein